MDGIAVGDQVLAVRFPPWAERAGAVRRGRAPGGLGNHWLQTFGVWIPRERRAEIGWKFRVQGPVACDGVDQGEHPGIWRCAAERQGYGDGTDASM